MHCPKCGQIYGKGTQRFCDLDGARLVSRSGDGVQKNRQSIFSTILPIGEIGVSTSPAANGEPQEISTDNADVKSSHDGSELFFESDNDEDETHFLNFSDSGGEIEVERYEDRAMARKISPSEIPSGHMHINEDGERDHPSMKEPMFDLDDPDAFVGYRVKGRYQVIEMLGEDDTGFAFLAEDRIVDDKRVMVRILTNEDLDEITESIFTEERISLSHLDHPNVVRVFDSGQFADGTTFLISEFLDALTVADILHINGPLDPMRVARIVRQAGEGLSIVHKEGILHRDLRPEDVVVARVDDELEIVKLSDFGVSGGSPNDENLMYRAPEILEGRIPTIASDVFSLGVIAYQILTGRLPYIAETPRQLLDEQNAGLKKLPGSIRREISGEVDYVFEKVLAPEPLLRYPTAREFGDALYAALTEVRRDDAEDTEDKEPVPFSSSRIPVIPATDSSAVENGSLISAGSAAAVYPEIQPAAEIAESTGDAAWTRRSPEPLSEPHRDWLKIAIITFAILAIVAAGIWYYLLNRPADPSVVVPPETPAPRASIDPAAQLPDGTIQIEVPPVPRRIAQPPNTESFQNTRQALKGDILRNFVGFSVYYPKEWKTAGPQESTTTNGRGKFLDISDSTRDGNLKEQLLIGYYPSSGTYITDAPKFAELSKEASETLKKLIPNYQMVSEGETSVNGGWRAYEIKFQGTGTAENGQRLLVWGRRLFMPASRPGVRAGFEITMLATSNADDVHSVDDVGVRGELAAIFTTFEPSQNF